MTKESAGDSGSKIGELTRDLRMARENAEKFEKQFNDTNKTLEARTKNFMSEKADIKLQLDKALADLKKVGSNSSDMVNENRELKSELDKAQKRLKDVEA